MGAIEFGLTPLIPDSSTAEQSTVNRQVLGSNPSQGARNSTTLRSGASRLFLGMTINRRSFLQGSVTVALSSLFGFSTKAEAASTKIVKLTKVKVGANFKFTLPNGAPALLFRTKTGVFAYQTICTHQGGQVNYLSASKLLICSLHNASFDPFKKAQVVAGPTGSSKNSIMPLPSVKVKVAGAWVILT